jgi:hypothetical protein
MALAAEIPDFFTKSLSRRNCQAFFDMYNKRPSILESAVKTAVRICIGPLSMREVTRWRW